MMWRIVRAEVSGPHSLDLTFKDGTRKQVNLLPLLEGPVFEPLRDPVFFCAGHARSSCWNGGMAKRSGYRPRSALRVAGRGQGPHPAAIADPRAATDRGSRPRPLSANVSPRGEAGRTWTSTRLRSGACPASRGIYEHLPELAHGFPVGPRAEESSLRSRVT